MTPSAGHPWQDPRLSPGERAAALIPLMTLEEKIAQLAGIWVGADATGAGVAPHQADMVDGQPFDEVIRHELGQLTRPFGHGLSYTAFEWSAVGVGPGRRLRPEIRLDAVPLSASGVSGRSL
ncbi:MAG TPA: hypothetical protein VFQ37_12900 [Mycobacterium sp.]|nr:hypothetical protein [Mycobacterium sp.]